MILGSCTSFFHILKTVKEAPAGPLRYQFSKKATTPSRMGHPNEPDPYVIHTDSSEAVTVCHASTNRDAS